MIILNLLQAHPDITIIKSSDRNLNIMRNSDKKIVFSLETEEEILFVYSQDEEQKYYKNTFVTTFHFLEQDLVYNDNNLYESHIIFYRSNTLLQKKTKKS